MAAPDGLTALPRDSPAIPAGDEIEARSAAVAARLYTGCRCPVTRNLKFFAGLSLGNGFSLSL